MISLIHPSRGRPEKAYDTLFYWWGRLPNPGIKDKDFEHILSLDSDDLYLESYQFKFKTQFTAVYNKIVNENKSVVDATNQAAKVSKGDIIIYLSDDFHCPTDWIKHVNKEFEGVTEPMLLKVDDCLQRFETPVVTIPIMNRALYERLGYFWNPEYKSMFVDEDLFWTCAKMKCIKKAPHLQFPHQHYSVGKAYIDETYRRSEANWNQGKEVFARRKAAGFPL